jgi:hypothetical protein
VRNVEIPRDRQIRVYNKYVKESAHRVYEASGASKRDMICLGHKPKLGWSQYKEKGNRFRLKVTRKRSGIKDIHKEQAQLKLCFGSSSTPQTTGANGGNRRIMQSPGFRD